MGTAITGATVSVNGVQALRQGERFLARVAVDNATQAVETNLTVVAVWFGSSASVVRSPLSVVYSDLCPFGFQSKYYDTETALYYYGHRYYDPATGKWLSRDPKGETATEPNLLAFCRNDPVNGVDPLGLENIVVSGTDGGQFFSKDVSDEKAVTSYLDYAGIHEH